MCGTREPKRNARELMRRTREMMRSARELMRGGGEPPCSARERLRGARETLRLALGVPRRSSGGAAHIKSARQCLADARDPSGVRRRARRLGRF